MFPTQIGIKNEVGHQCREVRLPPYSATCCHHPAGQCSVHSWDTRAIRYKCGLTLLCCMICMFFLWLCRLVFIIIIIVIVIVIVIIIIIIIIILYICI